MNMYDTQFYHMLKVRGRPSTSVKMLYYIFQVLLKNASKDCFRDFKRFARVVCIAVEWVLLMA